MLLLALHVLFLALALPPGASGAAWGHSAQIAFDEASWTKATWPEFKLDLPSRPTQPSDGPQMGTVRDLIENCNYASIDGPGSRSLLPEKKRKSSISVKSNDGENGAVKADIITKEFQVIPASKAIVCEVCDSMVEDVFHTVQHVSDQDMIVNEDVLLALLQKACDDKIVHQVLGKHAVVAMEGTPMKGWKTGEKYGLQLRPNSLSVQEKEVAAVKKSCKSILRDMDVHIAEKMFVALRNLKATRERLVQSSKDDPTECEDNNSQCALWALRGECNKNPNYMLNHCKASCGVCQGPRSSKLKDATAAAIARLKQDSCAQIPLCFTGKGKPAKGSTTFHERVLKHEMERDAVKPSGSAADKSAHEKEVGQSIDIVIQQDLGEMKEKCMFLNQGWWTYQVCYKQAIRQLHLAQGNVEIKHDMGLYNEELTVDTVSSGPEVLDATDLLPGMSERLPFVRQIYTDGSPCEEGSALLRETELRIACSTKAGIHMKISEPRKCSYIVVLYLPSLCQHPDYRPKVVVDNLAE